MPGKRGGGGGDPVAQFWTALQNQKMDSLRWTLSNANGLVASTQNEDGKTSFMQACACDKTKSLQMLIDFYARAQALRESGWLECKDDKGRTALMYAAEYGNAKCVDTLLDAQPQGRTDRPKSANDMSFAIMLCGQKDAKGHTALDIAKRNNKTNVVDMLTEFLAPPEELTAEEAAKQANPEGVSATQASKQKKRELMEASGGDSLAKAKEQEKAASDRKASEKAASEAAAAIKDRKALWPEVAKADSNAEKTSKICELTIVRKAAGDDCPAYGDAANPVDPALWDLTMLNRLSLRLPAGTLTSLPGAQLSRLTAMQTLILSGNDLTSLPEEIGELSLLKVLEVENNKLAALPAGLQKCAKLEVVKVGGNQLTSLSGLEGLVNINRLQCFSNKITTLDAVDFPKLTRLTELLAQQNEIDAVPDLSQCTYLSTLSMHTNKLADLPASLCGLKKLKDMDFSSNPFSDPKVRKLLDVKGSKGISGVQKYLEKNGKKAGGGGGKKNKKKKQVESSDEEDDDE